MKWVIIGAGVASVALYLATRKTETPAPVDAPGGAPQQPGVIGTWLDEIVAKVDTMLLPRGIRNNNPFNMKRTGIPWRGKRPEHLNTDDNKTFEQFDTPLNGIRAGLRDLWTDYHRDGQRTIRALITEFAPGSENDTGSYIRSVSKAVGKGPDEILSFPADMLAMAKAIIAHENGAGYRDYYPDSLIHQAITEAVS